MTVELEGTEQDFYVRVPVDECVNRDAPLGCGASRAEHPMGWEGNRPHAYKAGRVRYIPIAYARYDGGVWVERSDTDPLRPVAPRGADRPYANPMLPGWIDESGVEWHACDPYPTWYRWANGQLYTRKD